MNHAEAVRQRLVRLKKENIIISSHALAQAMFRGITIEDVKENIINPARLCYAIRQEARKPGEEKYDCYFGYSKALCHRYVLVINGNCLICTIIKVNRRWQRRAEKHAKIQL